MLEAIVLILVILFLVSLFARPAGVALPGGHLISIVLFVLVLLLLLGLIGGIA
jgi:hypothetical protein